MRYRTAARALALLAAFPTTLTATPSAWAGSGWQGSGLTVLGFLGVFVGIPVGLFVLITLVFVLLPARRKRRHTSDHHTSMDSPAADGRHGNRDTRSDARGGVGWVKGSTGAGG